MTPTALTRQVSDRADTRGTESEVNTKMERHQVIKNQLEDLTTVFDDGRRTAVDLNSDGQNSIEVDGSRINIDPSTPDHYGVDGANALRILADIVSHEVEHKRQSDLAGKRDFMRANLRAPEVAGMVINIMEDAYIDRQRVEHFPGLRKTQAFGIERLMADDDARPPIDTLAEDIHPIAAMIEGMVQVSNAGYAKGIKSAPSEVRSFLGEFRNDLDVVRNTHDSDARVEVAQRTFDRLCDEAELADLPPGLQDFIDEMIDEHGPGQPGEPDAPGQSGDNPFDADESGDAGDAGDDDQDGDAQEGSESSDGSTDESAADADSDAEPSGDADDALESMDAMDESRDVREHFGLDADADLSSDAEFERRYERMQQELQGDDDPMADRKEARQERATDYSGRNDIPDIEGEMRASGLADDIEEAFGELATADRETPARQGQRLNIRAAVRREAGDSTVEEMYFRREVAELGDRVVGVCLDMSSSMSGDDTIAKTALAALATGAEAVGDEFVANAFHGYTTTDLITAPDEDFSFDQLDTTRPRGGTNIAAALDDMGAMLRTQSAREKVLFVVTDGSPMGGMAPSDGSYESLRDEIQDYVHTLRSDGVVVIGIGAGDGIEESKMDDMFGHDNVLMVDMDNLVDELVTAYRAQMRDAGTDY